MTWLVYGESGAYSDYTMGGVAAFESEEDAKAVVERLNAMRGERYHFKCEKPGCTGWYTDGYYKPPIKRHMIQRCQFAPPKPEGDWESYDCVELTDGSELLAALFPDGEGPAR